MSAKLPIVGITPANGARLIADLWAMGWRSQVGAESAADLKLSDATHIWLYNGSAYPYTICRAGGTVFSSVERVMDNDALMPVNSPAHMLDYLRRLNIRPS